MKTEAVKGAQIYEWNPAVPEQPDRQGDTLREAARRAVQKYLDDMGDHDTDGLHQLVMAEVEGPPPSWYHHAWDYTEETPYSFKDPTEFSCQPNRGDTGKPFFLLNHWIERVSPSRVDAVHINDYEFLLDRAQQCAEERGQIPNFVSVNFYLIGEVVDVADELNGVRDSDGL